MRRPKSPGFSVALSKLKLLREQRYGGISMFRKATWLPHPKQRRELTKTPGKTPAKTLGISPTMPPDRGMTRKLPPRTSTYENRYATILTKDPVFTDQIRQCLHTTYPLAPHCLQMHCSAKHLILCTHRHPVKHEITNYQNYFQVSRRNRSRATRTVFEWASTV